jgi:hypothetical protein
MMYFPFDWQLFVAAFFYTPSFTILATTKQKRQNGQNVGIRTDPALPTRNKSTTLQVTKLDEEEERESL